MCGLRDPQPGLRRANRAASQPQGALQDCLDGGPRLCPHHGDPALQCRLRRRTLACQEDCVGAEPGRRPDAAIRDHARLWAPIHQSHRQHCTNAEALGAGYHGQRAGGSGRRWHAEPRSIPSGTSPQGGHDSHGGRGGQGYRSWPPQRARREHTQVKGYCRGEARGPADARGHTCSWKRRTSA